MKFVSIFLSTMLLFASMASHAQDSVPKLQIIKKLHPYGTDLYRKLTRIHDLTVDFEIENPSHMTAIGHVNLTHRGIPYQWEDGYNGKYPVAYSLRLTLKYSQTKEGLGPVDKNMFPPVGEIVEGSITGANINGIKDHYALGSFEGYQLLDQPGWYRLELWGTSASTVAPVDGLIEVEPTNGEITYNQIIVRVEEAQ